MNYVFNFHPTCANKQIVTAPDGLHIVCFDCGVMANVEAISGKTSPSEALKVGKQSEVNRKIEGRTSVGVTI